MLNSTGFLILLDKVGVFNFLKLFLTLSSLFLLALGIFFRILMLVKHNAFLLDLFEQLIIVKQILNVVEILHSILSIKILAHKEVLTVHL